MTRDYIKVKNKKIITVSYRNVHVLIKAGLKSL